MCKLIKDKEITKGIIDKRVINVTLNFKKDESIGTKIPQKSDY